jgi:hypothetical protein
LVLHWKTLTKKKNFEQNFKMSSDRTNLTSFCFSSLNSSFAEPKFVNKLSLLSANLTFLVYTLLTIVVAVIFFVMQRKKLQDRVIKFNKRIPLYAFSNEKNLSKVTLTTAFNAGGDMSISLLASTIISQWTWAASLLQSTTVGTQAI